MIKIWLHETMVDLESYPQMDKCFYFLHYTDEVGHSTFQSIYVGEPREFFIQYNA
jgi:hypothetical protein